MAGAFLSRPSMTLFDPTNLAIILCEPQQPGNIGSVARAMANFGVSDLRLVNPCQHLHPEARKFAVAANHLLGTAKIFPDLASAIADLHCTIATTRRKGRLRGNLLDSTEVPALLGKLPPGTSVGLVFGREDCGLSSQEVALCSHAASVATTSDIGSLNLAQAVLLFLYELARNPAPATNQELATENDIPPQGDMEELFQLQEEVLTRIAYLNPSRPEATLNPLRNIHRKAQLSVVELNFLRGMWRQLALSINDWPGKKRGES